VDKDSLYGDGKITIAFLCILPWIIIRKNRNIISDVRQWACDEEQSFSLSLSLFISSRLFSQNEQISPPPSPFVVSVDKTNQFQYYPESNMIYQSPLIIYVLFYYRSFRHGTKFKTKAISLSSREIASIPIIALNLNPPSTNLRDSMTSHWLNCSDESTWGSRSGRYEAYSSVRYDAIPQMTVICVVCLFVVYLTMLSIS
jgi:hypothetical protein